MLPLESLIAPPIPAEPGFPLAAPSKLSLNIAWGGIPILWTVNQVQGFPRWAYIGRDVINPPSCKDTGFYWTSLEVCAFP